MKQYWRQIAIAVLSLIFLASTIWYLMFQATALRDARRLEALAEATKPTVGLVTVKKPKPKPAEPTGQTPHTEPTQAEVPVQTEPEEINREKFSALLEQNGDFVGWLSCDEIGLSYPVMHSPDDPEFYLYRDFYGRKSATGVPFMDGGCNPLSKNIIIYGHNMQNGTVFAPLLSYEGQVFADQHPYIRFETLYDSAVYQVVAAFYESIHYADDEEAFRFYTYGGDLTRGRFEDYVDRCMEASTIDMGEEVTYDDDLLTLITCAYQHKNGRFVVVAKRVYYEDVIEELYAPNDGENILP